MYSNIKEYISGTKFLKKYKVPPIIIMSALTFMVILLILVFNYISDHRAEAGINALSKNVVNLTDNGMYAPKNNTLSMLQSVLLPDDKKASINMNIIYYETLREFANRPEVYLSPDKADDIQDDILQLEKVISLEDKLDFTRMSIDGKEVAFIILEQIYKSFGLKLSLSIDGNIEKITDQAGNILYQGSTEVLRDGLHIDALFIILGIILVLLVLNIILANKNQLFVKEVPYDGFDEKRFA